MKTQNLLSAGGCICVLAGLFIWLTFIYDQASDGNHLNTSYLLRGCATMTFGYLLLRQSRRPRF